MNKVKQFIIDNSQEFAEAVAQGYSIIMREDEILEWMQKYADSKVKKLNKPAVSVNEVKVCPICGVPFYYLYNKDYYQQQCDCDLSGQT